MPVDRRVRSGQAESDPGAGPVKEKPDRLHLCPSRTLPYACVTLTLPYPMPALP